MGGAISVSLAVWRLKEEYSNDIHSLGCFYIVGVGCGFVHVANVVRSRLVGSARVLPGIDSSRGVDGG